MPCHPFERLPLGAARVSALALLGAWLLLTMLLAAALPAEHAAQLAGFLRVADARDATALVAAWPAEVRATAGFVLGFDFLYDLVHNNAVALLAVWAARRHGGRRVMVAARAVAWTMWLDVLLNVVENLTMLRIVRDAAAPQWFPIMVAIAGFRFVTLWAGFAVGVATLLVRRVGAESNEGGDQP
jgi:hypothetical protein